MVFDELHINSLAVDVAGAGRAWPGGCSTTCSRTPPPAARRAATLEVRQSNEAARALYEGLGFSVEGVRRDYYQDPREDALMLWHRHLTAVAADRDVEPGIW